MRVFEAVFELSNPEEILSWCLYSGNFESLPMYTLSHSQNKQKSAEIKKYYYLGFLNFSNIENWILTSDFWEWCSLHTMFLFTTWLLLDSGQSFPPCVVRLGCTAARIFPCWFFTRVTKLFGVGLRNCNWEVVLFCRLLLCGLSTKRASGVPCSKMQIRPSLARINSVFFFFCNQASTYNRGWTAWLANTVQCKQCV